MSISISCPHCQARFRADERIAGREVGCPKCGGKFVVPKVAPSQPPPLPLTAPQVATTPVQPNPLGFLESTPPPPPNRSNVAPKSKDSRRAWQALAVGVAIGIIWILIDGKFLPINSHRNQTTASVNPMPATTTSEIDYHSAPTTTLTADYCPFQEGTHLKYIRMRFQGDVVSLQGEDISFESGGCARVKYEPRMHIFASDDSSHQQIIDAPSESYSDLFKLNNGFVEQVVNVGGESIGWEPVLKIGGVPGDQWSRKYGEEKGFTSIYHLAFLGGFKGYAVAAVHEKKVLSDGSPLGQSLYWYIKGLGLVREEGGVYTNGIYKEAYRVYLSQPQLPFSLDELSPDKLLNRAAPTN